MEYEPIVKTAVKAGQVLKRYFGESLEIEGKSQPSDFRTKADLESEKVIINELAKYYPLFSILAEENGFIKKNSEYCFIVDPLDGTNNFVLGIPNFTVSIALQKNGKTIFGVVYQPITNQIFQAERGKGAILDGHKIKVNAESDFKNASIAVSLGYAFPDKVLNTAQSLCFAKKCKRFMNNWSVAYDLCSLALGRIEVMINYNCEIHDFAAGKIIAEEAGAFVTDYQGKPADDQNCRFVATNGTGIHQKILKLVSQIDKI